jgi:hypothetical protein
MSSEDTGKKHSGPQLFQPGQSGNPNGRPKGARSKLGEAFIQALHDDFTANGVKVIEKVRTERPHEYLKVVASLLPKQVEIKEDAFGDLTDDELTAIVAAARSTIAVHREGGSGTEDEAESQPPGGLSALH